MLAMPRMSSDHCIPFSLDSIPNLPTHDDRGIFRQLVSHTPQNPKKCRMHYAVFLLLPSLQITELSENTKMDLKDAQDMA